MRGLLAIIPLLVLAVHALVGQSGVMICLGGSHGRITGVAAAPGGEACSHGAGLVLPAAPGAVGHGHADDGPVNSVPVDHDNHHEDECSCTDLLIGLRDEVTVPRVHDDGQVWAVAAWAPCPWACEASLHVVAGPDRGRGSFQDPGGACCLAIVRSTRLLS